MKRNTKIELASLAGGATAVAAAALYIHKHRESPRKGVSPRKARKIGDDLGVDWNRIPLDEFRRGMELELEHGRRDPATDITNDDLILTGKIALAHLKEFPDYYTRLARMEEEARAYWHRESTELESRAS